MFSAELMFFDEHKEDWVQQHPGWFVVIQGGVVAGFHKTYADAFRAGLATFGSQRPFLIKQIWKDDPVYFVA